MLLATKLFIPRPRGESLLRPRLLDRLDAGLAGKLLLISAPAGFGKTTLVADWLAHSARLVQPQAQPQAQSQTQSQRSHNDLSTHGHTPNGALINQTGVNQGDNGKFTCTWLALDEGDNDPVRFFSYLVAALQKVDAQLGVPAQQMLLAPQPPAFDTLMTALVNELAESATPLALVFDDYHAISEAAIHQAMAFLIEQLPPQMRVILISRADPPLPLGRLRVRREVSEVRAHDLRFSLSEAESFLRQAVGRTLGASDVAALEERTEGWIAGLQLAALSMSEREDVESFIRSFTGSNVFVMDYLTEEVLHRLAPEVQEFLYATAVLDRFCGPLCDAVRQATVQVTEGDSQGYLERLEKAHLFLVPLDDERGWYRYHHLFADLLRSRLLQTRPSLIPQLHRRAGAWFLENGWPLDGVSHTLAGQDFPGAAAAIEQSALLLLNRGETITLLQWLDRLPAEEVRRRPRLSLVRAKVAMRAHRLQEAENYLQETESHLQEAGPQAPANRQAIGGEILAIRSNIALNSNRLPAAIQLGEEALALLPAEERSVRGEVMMHLGLALLWSGHYAQASTHFVEAARQSESAGDIYTAILSHANHGTLFYMQGQLQRAAAKFRQTLAFAEQHGVLQMPTVAAAYQPLAELHYEWNDLAQADKYAQQAIECGVRSGNPRLLLLCYVIQARIQIAEGKADVARTTVEQARRLVEERALPSRYANEVNTLEVRYWLSQNEMAQAVGWVMNNGLHADDAELAGKEGQYRLVARVLLAQGNLDGSLLLLQRLLASARQAGKLLSQMETLALTSVVEILLGREQAALASLQQALLPAEAEGYVRTFLDEGAQMGRLLRLWLDAARQDVPEQARLAPYVTRLLTAWQTAAAVQQERGHTRDTEATAGSKEAPATLTEPLSERELEVLQLVAEGLSDRQVADRLVIVPGTVKRHLNSLYGKLGVHSRVQAVARARQLALLKNPR